MRIARTAATLGLVLAAAACGATTATEPDLGENSRVGSERKEMVSPASAAPRMGGNYIGSGN
jgi:hypothetical protein